MKSRTAQPLLYQPCALSLDQNAFQSTLATNGVDSTYPMTAKTHRIGINLEMYHCAAKILFFLWLTNTKKELERGFAGKNNENCNVETVRNLCKWEIVDFDGISYGDISEIIQSYFTNRSENWIEIFRQFCSWSSLYRVWPALVAITALSRRGMLRTRTPILSGVTSP